MRSRLLLLALPLFLLAGCGDDPVRVGSKNFTENRILAELITQVLEAEGIPAEPHIGIGDTRAVFEALRTGEIDIYPEYSGTALALLGMPVTADPAESRERASAEFAHLGIETGQPFGFDSRFAIVMLADLAERDGIARISDLEATAGGLVLAVTDEFARRPLDGLVPLVESYGLAFGDVVVVPERERAGLIDLLIDGGADVAVLLENDSAIADFGLLPLADDAGFFPSYEAFPLIARDALEARPDLEGALATLSGRIDAATISDLVAQIDLSGRNPRNVAREFLATQGVISAVTPTFDHPPMLIAINSADIGTTMANEVLRAARETMPNRIIRFEPDPTPIDSVLAGEARVALVPAVSMFEQSVQGARIDPRVESIAAVGSHFVQALAAGDGPTSLQGAGRIATGPPGSASNRLGRVIAETLDPEPEIIALESSDAAAGAAAIAADRADLALLLAPLGRRDIAEALTGNPGLQLVPAAGWWQGATRLAQPYPRPAIIPAGTYPTVTARIETLAMQAVVIGPATNSAAMGHQGPITYTGDPQPVTEAVVRSFNENLGDNPDVNPLLHPSAALQPQPDPAMQPLNRQPAYTVFSLLIICFIAWAIWLLTRPLNKGLRHD